MRDILNDWDSTIGDGDCGSAMYKGATAILDDMKKYYPLNNAAETVNEIGSSVRRAMGGTSGVLYTIFCKAAYAQLKANSDSTVTAKQWAEALEAAIAAVSKYGGASTGYRTLLDALIPALAVLKERLTSGEDSCTSFVLSSEAAVAGAGSTKDMQAQGCDGVGVYAGWAVKLCVSSYTCNSSGSWSDGSSCVVQSCSFGCEG
ncbi:hypothetical protein ERO13_D07G065501v2 [Gossypium hirsutum]|nr:hypothetical protein ERO13_D07G065501v2 [Gossypium hirsutum]